MMNCAATTIPTAPRGSRLVALLAAGLLALALLPASASAADTITSETLLFTPDLQADFELPEDWWQIIPPLEGGGSVNVHPDAGEIPPFLCQPGSDLPVQVDGEWVCEDGSPPVIIGSWNNACAAADLEPPPSRIFQICDWLPPTEDTIRVMQLLDELEKEAVDEVLAAHGLPPSDRQKVLAFARDDVRAAIYIRLLEIFDTVFRTPDQQLIFEFFGLHIVHKRSFAAWYSVQEWHRWEADPCAYQPPDGFSYTPDQSICATPIGGLFSGVSPPSFEEFQAYGAQAAYGYYRDPELALIPVQTAAALEYKVGLTVAGAVVVGAVVATTIAAAASAIFPFSAGISAAFLGGLAAKFGAASAAAAAAAGTAVGVAAAIGAAIFVILAVVIAVIQGIFVFEEAEIGSRLHEAHFTATQTFPDLWGMIRTEDGPRELFLAIVDTTLPDYPSEAAPPGPSATDRLFAITDEHGNGRTASPYISFFTWDDSDWQAWLSGGWFVAEAEETIDGVPFETMTLQIAYVNWTGENWTAWRMEDEKFLHTKQGDIDASFVSGEIRYLDQDGAPRIATIFVDDTPPVITAEIDGELGDNGWYVSDVSLSWTVVDEESDIISTSGCVAETIDTDTSAFVRTCTATSLGGEASQSVTIKRDATPPTADPTVSPPPNELGWHKSDVVVTYNWTDATSGLTVASSRVTITQEGADLDETGTATDFAGNTASITVEGINIDRTPPTVVLSAPADGATFVLNEVVLAGWEASDALSGVDSESGTVASGQAIDTASAGEKSFTVTATDAAGNTTVVEHLYTVFTPSEASATLIVEVEAMELVRGAETSLTSILGNAQQSLERGNLTAATGQIQAFIDQVNEKRDEEQIGADEADALIAYAMLILDALPPSS